MRARHLSSRRQQFADPALPSPGERIPHAALPVDSPSAESGSSHQQILAVVAKARAFDVRRESSFFGDCQTGSRDNGRSPGQTS
jgi:hypothetical protein